MPEVTSATRLADSNDQDKAAASHVLVSSDSHAPSSTPQAIEATTHAPNAQSNHPHHGRSDGLKGRRGIVAPATGCPSAYSVPMGRMTRRVGMSIYEKINFDETISAEKCEEQQ
jgi:hypothetical protein